MFRPREYTAEAPEHQLEATLRVLRRQVWSGRLFPDKEFYFWDEIDDELAIGTQSCLHGVPPMTNLYFALGEDLMNQHLESPCQGRVGNVAFVLVELGRREKSAQRNKRLVQLVHHRGFADARITGHKHELWPTLRHDPVEGCEQCVNLALSTIQLFGNQQPVWNVLLANRKFVDVVLRLPLIKATPKITLHADCCLVSLLGSFGE